MNISLSFQCFLVSALLASTSHAANPNKNKKKKAKNQKGHTKSDKSHTKSDKSHTKSDKSHTKSDKTDRSADDGGGFEETCPGITSEPTPSAVYTMTNQPTNEILVYSRDPYTGKLTFENKVATEGMGGRLSSSSGPPENAVLPETFLDPLASTGSITVAGNCLLAVNAGSNDISTFRIASSSEIYKTGIVDSGGDFPLSITEKEGLVYVLNGGGQGHIHGFHLTEYNCMLSPIGDPVELDQGETVTPTDPNFFPATAAQIGFTPEGNIMVTIKINGGGQNFPSGFGSLNTYFIDPESGTTSEDDLDQMVISDPPGAIPFSFDFDDKGNLLVIEAFGEGGAPMGMGQANVFVNGTLVSEVGTGQPDSCWIQHNPRNSCVYTTNNNGGDSISSFHLEDAALELVESEAATLNTPLDMDIHPDNRFLYALSTGHNDGTGQPRIYVYEMGCDCGLREVQAIADGLDTEEMRIEQDGVLFGVVGLGLY